MAEEEDEEKLELLEDAEELDGWDALLSPSDTAPEVPPEFVPDAPHAATRAEPADKPANRRKSRR